MEEEKRQAFNPLTEIIKISVAMQKGVGAQFLSKNFHLLRALQTSLKNKIRSTA